MRVALLALCFLVGCGGSDPTPAGLRRLLEDPPAGARLVQGPSRPGPVLDAAPPEGWTAAAEPSIGTLAFPAADQPGWGVPWTLRQPGRWVREIVLAGEEPLHLGVDVHFEGEVGAARASMTVLEYDRSVDLAQAHVGLMGHSGAAHAAAAQGAAQLQIDIEPRVGVHSIVVSLVLDLDLGVAGSVSFENFVVRQFGDRETLVSLGGSEPAASDDETLALGHYSVEECLRPGIALLAGGQVFLPVTTTLELDTLEFHAGLVELFGWSAPVAASFVVEVETSEGVLPLVADELRAATPVDARWQRYSVEWPEAARGKPATLRVAAADGPPLPAAIVFGELQLVEREPEDERLNVILVSLDTLRADRLGCYGYERDTSPRLDAFAKDALRFSNTRSQGAYTLPTHVSMLSGQFPSVHGVHNTKSGIDPARTKLLAQVLASEGYRTGAFTGGGFLQPDFGFYVGFDRYGIVDPVLNLDSDRIRGRLRVDPMLSVELAHENDIERVNGWIDAQGEHPFFLFLHTYMTHDFDAPLSALEQLGLESRRFENDLEARRVLGAPGLERILEPSEAVLDRMHDYYDGTVRHVDAEIGKLLDHLEARGLLENTVVVITSDHGKEIGEHGAVGHGNSLFDELIGIPLIVHVPGFSGAVDDLPAMSIDIVPTILDALRLAPLPDVQGTSLLRPRPERVQFSELEMPAFTYRAAVTPQQVKTIWGQPGPTGEGTAPPVEASYDLARDPGELSPLAPDEERLRAVQDFHGALQELRAGAGQEAGALSPRAIANLRALGYVDVGN